MYKDGENMQVEQKNLWDNVTRSLSDDACKNSYKKIELGTGKK